MPLDPRVLPFPVPCIHSGGGATASGRDNKGTRQQRQHTPPFTTRRVEVDGEQVNAQAKERARLTGRRGGRREAARREGGKQVYKGKHAREGIG